MDDKEKSERITDAHNAGEKAGSKYNSDYEEPHSQASIAGSVFLDTKENVEQMESENEAYREGWDNGRSQRH